MANYILKKNDAGATLLHDGDVVVGILDVSSGIFIPAGEAPAQKRREVGRWLSQQGYKVRFVSGDSGSTGAAPAEDANDGDGDEAEESPKESVPGAPAPPPDDGGSKEIHWKRASSADEPPPVSAVFKPQSGCDGRGEAESESPALLRLREENAALRADLARVRGAPVGVGERFRAEDGLGSKLNADFAEVEVKQVNRSLPPEVRIKFPKKG